MLDEASGSELRRRILNQNVSPRGPVERRRPASMERG